MQNQCGPQWTRLLSSVGHTPNLGVAGTAAESGGSDPRTFSPLPPSRSSSPSSRRQRDSNHHRLPLYPNPPVAPSSPSPFHSPQARLRPSWPPPPAVASSNDKHSLSYKWSQKSRAAVVHVR